MQSPNSIGISCSQVVAVDLDLGADAHEKQGRLKGYEERL